jgi:alkyl sulfatase BDS1-like metallo-beta-lactamase superfamily hydrolase
MLFEEATVRPMTARLQIMVNGIGGADFAVLIEGNRLNITDGQITSPDATVHISTRDLEDLLRHRISAVELVSEGRLQIRGSLPQAARAYVTISRATRFSQGAS